MPGQVNMRFLREIKRFIEQHRIRRVAESCENPCIRGEFQAVMLGMRDLVFNSLDRLVGSVFNIIDYNPTV